MGVVGCQTPHQLVETSHVGRIDEQVHVAGRAKLGMGPPERRGRLALEEDDVEPVLGQQGDRPTAGVGDALGSPAVRQLLEAEHAVGLSAERAAVGVELVGQHRRQPMLDGGPHQRHGVGHLG